MKKCKTPTTNPYGEYRLVVTLLVPPHMYRAFERARKAEHLTRSRWLIGAMQLALSARREGRHLTRMGDEV